jgi:hypothetical protein
MDQMAQALSNLQDEKVPELKVPEMTTQESKTFFISLQKSWLDRSGGDRAIQDRMNRFIGLESSHQSAANKLQTAMKYEKICREKKEAMRFFCEKDKVIKHSDFLAAQEAFIDAKKKKAKEEQEKENEAFKKISSKGASKRARREMEEPNFC